ncbi:MAG: outer membrane lipoprotein-sorting protein [Thermodesulfobacteriota bacterium]|nr:outer membrane lipoprotein-sorting protein [Thermodesulfobacteriota bacterium]
MIRVRYEDIYKNDDVYSYIPVLRRIRRLTGSDLTDPMLGSDACYDDFQVWRQKINPRMTFKMRQNKFLVPVHLFKKPTHDFIKETFYQIDWNIRPIWILEVNINDPDYAYSRRVIYVEKEEDSYCLYAGENYDQKGRFWRSDSHFGYHRDRKTFVPSVFYGYIFADHLSNHSTLMDITPFPNDPNCTPEVFTIRYLIKMAR